MKLLNSLVNFGILKNNLKRYYLLALVTFVISFVTLPINFLANSENATKQTGDITYNRMLSALRFKSEGFVILFIACALGFILALVINRYLNTQNSTIFNHSLPVGKTKLYITNSVTALLIILVPFALIAAILMFEKLVFGWVTYRYVHVLKWFAILLICSMFIYSVVSFISMLTGSTVFAGLLGAAVLSLGYLICAGLIYTRYMLVKGTMFTTEELMVFDNITPLIKFAKIAYNSMGLVEGIVYIVLSIAFITLGMYVYKIRKNEKASETIAFDILKPIFKYIVTFLACLAFGLLGMELFDYNYFVVIICYVLGITSGYFIAEMIIQKGIFVFRNKKVLIGYLISLGIFVLFIIGIKNDITGYERRIPRIEEIEAADFAFAYKYAYGMENYYEEDTLSYNLETIEKIRELHKQLTKTSIRQIEYYSNSIGRGLSNNAIIYKLKNGKFFFREFVYDEEENLDLIKKLYEDDDFQYTRHKSSFEFEDKEFVNINLFNSALQTRKEIFNLEEARSLLAEIKKDIVNISYETQMYNDTSLSLSVNLIDWDEFDRLKSKENYKNMSDFQIKKYYANVQLSEIEINSQYTNTIKWLKDRGYYDSFVLNSNNVKNMTIVTREEYEQNENGYYDEKSMDIERTMVMERPTEEYDEKIIEKTEKYQRSVKITDKETINKILDNVSKNYLSEYVTMFEMDISNIPAEFYDHYGDDYFTNIQSRVIICYVEKGSVPEDIKNFFK